MKRVISKIKSGIVDATSDIISAPARMKSNRAIRQSSYDTKVLKADRANKQSGYRYNPNEGDYTDPKFRTSVEAIGVRERLQRKVK